MVMSRRALVAVALCAAVASAQPAKPTVLASFTALFNMSAVRSDGSTLSLLQTSYHTPAASLDVLATAYEGMDHELTVSSPSCTSALWDSRAGACNVTCFNGGSCPPPPPSEWRGAAWSRVGRYRCAPQAPRRLPAGAQPVGTFRCCSIQRSLRRRARGDCGRASLTPRMRAKVCGRLRPGPVHALDFHEPARCVCVCVCVCVCACVCVCVCMCVQMCVCVCVCVYV